MPKYEPLLFNNSWTCPVIYVGLYSIKRKALHITNPYYYVAIRLYKGEKTYKFPHLLDTWRAALTN